MAGIKVDPNRSWIVAGWVFRYLSERAMVRLKEGSAVRAAFQDASEGGLSWFSIEKWTADDQRILARIVAAIYEELEKTDSNQFSTREGYDGLMARIGELEDLLVHLRDE